MMHRFVGLALACLIGAGCSGDTTTPSSQSGPIAELAFAVDERMGEAPTIRVLEPTNGAEVRSPFTVRLIPEHFELAPAGRTRDGEGHWHVLVDEGCLAPGTVIPKDDRHFHVGSGEDTAEFELPPGDYELCVQVGDGFHVAVAITETIRVTVVE